jgi:hypothetical protein
MDVHHTRESRLVGDELRPRAHDVSSGGETAPNLAFEHVEGPAARTRALDPGGEPMQPMRERAPATGRELRPDLLDDGRVIAERSRDSRLEGVNELLDVIVDRPQHRRMLLEPGDHVRGVVGDLARQLRKVRHPQPVGPLDIGTDADARDVERR